MKNYSIRRRLISWISIPIALLSLLAMVSSYFFSRHEIEEIYDAQLVHSAKVLLQLSHHEILENQGFDLGIENLDLQHKYERNLGFRIWVGNNLVTQSPNTKAFGDFEANPGFSDQILDNNEWRFFVFLDPANKIKVEVSERLDVRYELILQLMFSIIVPILFLLPVILMIIWIGVRKVLTPVVKISFDMDRRDSNDLSPIQNTAIPEEIAPLLLALNRLFKRLEQSFKREREFTDHAAHELRTPLAAMKTQAQVLMKKAQSFPEAAAGLENLESSINRATHLLEQLLSLARLQHEDIKQERVNLSDVLRECVAEMAQYADRKNIHLTTNISNDCITQGHAASVSILLRNLLDNAIKYTPKGGTVSVVLGQDGDLTIADTGPGLSDIDKSRVFERFVRADKSGQSGSGLGLSIVKWIADAHAIDVKLIDNHPAGLKIIMKWDVIE